ncbi:hypothetical protein B0A49_05125 [Cryomyces minteri]|uniref:Transcriptional repressor Tup1 N-terminal domain-containing protein n=2 Tax=Cryomyces TaxID=329878 RepID=A0A4U0XMH1_9PEZI|nr:hypothetical protein B0A49_05125 [Cryomyces minteri]
MYNSHRGMGVPGAAPNNRLAELLDQVRAEFEAQGQRTAEYEHQLTAQIQEMDLVRQKVYQLEQTHITIKQRYEDDIARLHRELETRGGPSQSGVGGAHGGPSQPPPPAIGHGPRDLFGGIMAGATAQGGPGLAPPPQEQPPPQGLPQHLAQAPPGLNPAPGPPQHAPFGGYGPAGPGINGYGPQAPQSTASPGPGKARTNPRGPPGGPATPQQGQAAPYPGSPAIPRPTPPPGQQQQQLALAQQQQQQQIPDVGNMLADLEVDQLPPNLKREGSDWFAIFNPRVWDIGSRTIKHQFAGHEQDIYSLDFASNGRHIASGSGDRTVRLWDIESGQCVLTLAIEDGVTTVAISPDNQLVAAGSLDKSVRVWDTTTGFLVERLEGDPGHKDSVYSVAFAPNGKDLVSGSLDKTIRMWELTPPRGLAGGGPKGGKCVKIFEGHKDFVLSVALTPDGAWVMSGSKDRGVQFWDPQTGEAQLMLQGHKNSVISVAPSPTGNLFATGSGDTRARIWSYGPYRGQ